VRQPTSRAPVIEVIDDAGINVNGKFGVAGYGVSPGLNFADLSD
jgi:hypothetical protein